MSTTIRMITSNRWTRLPPMGTTNYPSNYKMTRMIMMVSRA